MEKTRTPIIPAGTKCELCGMVAEQVMIDEFGVTHFYCAHHLPPGLSKELGRPDHRQMPGHAEHMAAHAHHGAGHDHAAPPTLPKSSSMHSEHFASGPGGV